MRVGPLKTSRSYRRLYPLKESRSYKRLGSVKGHHHIEMLSIHNICTLGIANLYFKLFTQISKSLERYKS